MGSGDPSLVPDLPQPDVDPVMIEQAREIMRRTAPPPVEYPPGAPVPPRPLPELPEIEERSIAHLTTSLTDYIASAQGIENARKIVGRRFDGAVSPAKLGWHDVTVWVRDNLGGRTVADAYEALLDARVPSDFVRRAISRGLADTNPHLRRCVEIGYPELAE